MEIKLVIPVIDISGYYTGDVEAKARIASAIASAAQSPGFFQITGHRVSPDLISQLYKQLAAFFALPFDVKRSISTANSPVIRGYEAIGQQILEEGFVDSKEGFVFGREHPLEGARYLQGPNQWPEDSKVPGFKDVIMEYYKAVLNLSKIMFRLVALSLSLKEDYFDAFSGSEDSIAVMRAHRYPPTTPELAAKSRGIGAHTDFGALTLLLQDSIGGLEVFHKPTETWHPVKPVEGAFVVNIGDMLERWTNNRYTSTKHRVISPANDNYRYSVASFNQGLLDQMIECIPTCLEPGEKPLYEPVKVEEHLKARYSSSFKY
ncbi:2-oxoglutarate-Fe(II) type oxidoreductase hxnY [Cladobotryum mycophilum]|uniref:2-oxoglutarate-Fe(II) type oxidoreductase hxnY n=1 Tax=Cladobotryum mycophilum TaxID=491253 RepID=A0ABR0SN08_9HYPO